MSYPIEPLVHYAHHDTAQQRRDDAYEHAHAGLMQEVIDALTTDPTRHVSAPGTHGYGGEPITDVFDGYLAGPDAEQRRREVLTVLGRCTRSTDPLLRLPAQAIVIACATEHADLHADEAL